MKLKQTFLFFISFIGFSIILNAQVTIGLDQEPATAALLQLKTQISNDQNITSDKGGLLVSRVQLENNLTLQPFIPNIPSTEEKKEHVGLIVWHIGGNNINEGLMIWNGSQWLSLITTIPPAAPKMTNTYEYNVELDSLKHGPDNVKSYSQLNKLDFPDIKIQEKGIYAISLRFNGQHFSNESDKTGRNNLMTFAVTKRNQSNPTPIQMDLGTFNQMTPSNWNKIHLNFQVMFVTTQVDVDDIIEIWGADLKSQYTHVGIWGKGVRGRTSVIIWKL